MAERHVNNGEASRASPASATHALRHLTEASPGAGTGNGAAAADITIVRTARDLQAAIASGAQDVQVRGHLDLSSLALNFSTGRVLPDIRSTTRSIQGNCTAPPPPLSTFALSGAPLLWEPPQCVIVADQDLFRLEHRLWLDALCLRLRPSRSWYFVFLSVDTGAVMYGTRMTLQGDGQIDSRTMAVEMFNDARVYLHGSIVDSVGGPAPLFGVWHGSLHLQQVTLSNVNHTSVLSPGAEEAGALGPAPAPGPSGDYTPFDSVSRRDAAILLAWGDSATIVALNTTFENVTTPRGQVFLAHEDALVVAEDTTGAPEDVYTVDYDYADAPYDAYTSRTRTMDTVAAAPASAAEELPAQRVPLATANDPWFVALRQAVRGATPEQIQDAPKPPPNPPPPPTPGVAGGAPPQIAAVYSAEQLQRAFHAGVRDIEVRAHLDLRGLPRWDAPVDGRAPGQYQLGFVGNDTRSIRGRCKTRPPSALTPEGLDITLRAEEPWRALRCVLVVADHLIIADSPALWLDSLHIQIVPAEPGSASDYRYLYTYDSGSFDDYGSSYDGPLSRSDGVVALRLLSWAKVYVTDSTIQGDRDTLAAAAWLERCAGGLYMAGSVLNALPGRQLYYTAASAPAVHVSFGAALFDSCTFMELGADDEALDYYEQFHGNRYGVGAVDVRGGNASVALRNCSVAEASALEGRPFSVAIGAVVFSDDPDLMVADVYEYYAWDSGGERTAAYPADPLPQPPRGGRSARTPAPPQADDPWFLAAQQALKSPPPEAYVTEFSAPASEDAAGPAPAPGDAASPATAAASLSDEGSLSALSLRPPVDSDSGLGNAATIGIVLGALAVLAVATVAAAVVGKRWRGNPADGSTGEQPKRPPESAAAPTAAAAAEAGADQETDAADHGAVEEETAAT